VLFGGTDDRSHEARALGNLGLMHYYLCEFPEAVRHLQRALALYREAGDRLREARVLNTLGSLDMRLSRYQQAARYLWQALALHQEAGHKQGAASLATSNCTSATAAGPRVTSSRRWHCSVRWATGSGRPAR
jgi:tetratricopeptide (TPR) repeat protein